MPYSISNSLIRNIRDVSGESDPARRRAAIDELWAEDGVFYDPNKAAIKAIGQPLDLSSESRSVVNQVTTKVWLL